MKTNDDPVPPRHRVFWLSDWRFWPLAMPICLWLAYVVGLEFPFLEVVTILAAALAAAAVRDVWLVNARGVEVQGEVVEWYGGNCPEVAFTYGGLNVRQRLSQYVRRQAGAGARVTLLVDPNRPSRCYIV